MKSMKTLLSVLLSEILARKFLSEIMHAITLNEVLNLILIELARPVFNCPQIRLISEPID